jgi:hypothetical protein
MSVRFHVIQLIKSYTKYMQGIRIFPAGARDFSFLHSVWAGSGAHPASYFSPEGRGGKVAKCEADQSPQSSAKVKTGEAIPLPPQAHG